jgi:hypothetical protein
MEKRFELAALLLYCLAIAQPANACGSNIPLNKMDVAFAEVIIEGHIREVHPDASDKTSKLLFDVHNVIRGNVPQKQMTVIFQGGFAFSAPKSVEDFVRRYGHITRVAMTTPQQVEKLCKTQMVSSVNGLGDVTEIPLYSCDYSLLSLHPKAKDVPFVLRRVCGEPYIFDAKVYDKMENYEVNLETFKSLPRNAQTSDSYKEIVGGGALPWAYSQRVSIQSVAIELYREYTYLFTSNLNENEGIRGVLLSRGLAITKAYEKYYASLIQDEENQEYFNKSLWHHILQISSVIEKDPSFGERLLMTEADIK